MTGGTPRTRAGPGRRPPGRVRHARLALVGAFFSHALADPGRVAAAYGVSEEGVRAALLFYRRHQAVIDGRLALNEG